MDSRQITFEAIGTSWIIDLFDPITSAAFKELTLTIKNRIEQFDNNYSRFKSDSWVSQMAQAPRTYKLPPDAQLMLDLYKKLYPITNGAFTPLIGNTLVQAGYDASYSLRSSKLQPTLKWEEVLAYDAINLTIKKPAVLDFGAAGKGYLVDIVADLIHQAGIHNFCVDAGGDIAYRHDLSRDKLRVGLEHPNDASKVIGIVQLSNNSLCGSAGNRRVWGKYHHIIHPHSLTSPQSILAVWTVAKSTILADALSTCLFLEIDPKQLLPEFEFEYLIVYSDFTTSKSSGFPAEIYVK